MPVGRADAASLHVAIANAFGSDTRDAAYGRATPPPAVRILATPPPRIASLAVDPPRPDAPLTVRYSAEARDLRLSIVDRTGAIWFATTTPSGNGITQIPAPPAGPREPYLPGRAAPRARTPARRPAFRSPPPCPRPERERRSPRAAGPGTPASTAAASRRASAPARTRRSSTSAAATRSRSARSRCRPGQPFAVEIPFADGARVQIIRDRDDAELVRRRPAPRRAQRRDDRARRARRVHGPGHACSAASALETVVRPLRLARSDAELTIFAEGRVLGSITHRG